MAEPKQGASSVILKDKTAPLDEDIGKDFLGSWKSMSMKQDDSMDFSFDSMPKTNNKKFKFDNMDMDFNLDMDLDKITSFKMDMPDINFSFSPKKTTNSKDKMEETSGKNQEEKEKFSFSFDFNESDSFSFDPSLEQVEKAPEKKTDRNGVATGGSEGQSFKSIEAKENGKTEDGITAQLWQSMVTTKVDSLTDHQKKPDVISKSSPLSSVPSDNPVLSRGTKTSQMKAAISTELLNPGRHILETSMSKEKVSKQPMANMSEESEDTDTSNVGTATEVESELCSQKTKAVASRNGDEGTNDKVITRLESSNEKLLVKGSAALPAILPEKNKSGSSALPAILPEKNKSGSSALPAVLPEKNKSGSCETSSHSLSKSMSSNGRNRGDIDLCDTSTSNSIKMQRDVITNKETPSSPKMVSRAPLCSKVTLHKVTSMECIKEGAMDSSFFKRSEEINTRPHPESAAAIKVISVGNGETSSVDSIPTEKKSAQDGSKNSHNNWQNGRESTDIEVAAKLNVKSIKDCNSSGSLLNTSSSTGKAKTSTIQSHLGSNILNSSFASIQKSKITSSGKGHLCPPRPVNKLTDLSDMVISRNMELNKNPAEHIPAEKNHLRRNLVNEGNGESKVAISDRKHTTFSPSLKRKSSEAPTTDIMLLNPPKRLAESPTSSRNIKDTVEEISTEQNKEKTAFQIHGTSRTECNPKLQMADTGSPSIMHNDANVEKAESFTKELEDICNMLRRKHEEAKELMVRAIVNNNNLLMLYHPMHEEKVLKVQKFAAELMSKVLRV